MREKGAAAKDISPKVNFRTKTWNKPRRGEGVITLKFLNTLTFILLVIGGLNWLLVGLFHKDLFVMLGTSMDATLPVIVYILVGLSALYQLFTHWSRTNPAAPTITV